MTTNPQSGSASSNSSGGCRNQRKGEKKSLPPLFWYMETGEWSKATERAKRHPKEVKTWGSIRTKSADHHGSQKISGAKRLALHHACFKLRNAVSCGVSTDSTGSYEDPFIEICRFILLLLEIYPEAAGMRESRHGCLPLHLAAFASCTSSAPADDVSPLLSPLSMRKPGLLSRRCTSESTAETGLTNILVEEQYAGAQTLSQAAVRKNPLLLPGHRRNWSSISTSSPEVLEQEPELQQIPNISVSMTSNVLVSEKRESMAVQVLNALLDAFPRAIRMDSEGGRLPLHTACAGRATPRIISTLVTAYPAAARHRNKDGFLPLHLVAHWGISHPNVAISLLKVYPDATYGRNRWERTPLEEALCMAGENGRPHQSALVRSLRKHPSYWTRPADIFKSSADRRKRNQVVDIDASLPSIEDESTTDDGFLFGPGVAGGNMQLFGKEMRTGEGVETSLSPFPVDLPTLIKMQNWDAVVARLECNPDDAEEELQIMTRGGFLSSSGFHPLHYACERRPPVEVVEALIHACPSAVMTRTMPGGCLPLHIACTWHAPAASVSALIQAYNAACKVQDELGNLPLHSATFSGTDVVVTESLLRAYPKATLGRNHQGSLADEVCKRLRHDNRSIVLQMLARTKEAVLLKKHDRSESSGCMGAIAQKAIRLNERDGPPVSNPNVDFLEEDASAGLEAARDDADNQELVWI